MQFRNLAFVAAVALTIGSLDSQTPQADTRVGSVWMDHYPIVKAAVECVPSETSQQPCPPPQDLALAEESGSDTPATEVKTLSETATGVAVVLALDASGSMSGSPAAAIRRVLSSFADRARAADQLAILSFATDVRTEVPFGADKSTWPTVLESLKTRCCDTHLYDGLSNAISLLRAPGLSPVRRVILISDGKDEGSQNSIDDAIKQAVDGQIAVDTIGMTKIDAVYLDSLKKISSTTGGVFRYVKSDQDLERVVGLGINQMLSASVASFRLSHTPQDGAVHDLGIKRLGSSWRQDRRQPMPMSQPQPAPRPEARLFRNGLIIGSVAILALLAVLLFLVRHRSRRKREEQLVPTESVPPTASRQPSLGPPPVPGALAENSSLPPSESLSSKPTRPRRRTIILHRFEEPRTDRPSAWLTQIAGSNEHYVYALIKPKTWFGSAPTATVQLSNTLGVLPMHACIEFEDGSLYLSSESREAKVSLEEEEFALSRRIIQPGDKITVGDASFQLILSKPPR